MSRIGKAPIKLPEKVTIVVDTNSVKVAGPKGELILKIPAKIKVEVKDGQVLVTRLFENKQAKSSHGAIRAHLNNMIKGVTTPWSKELEIRGTGYKFSVNGPKLTVIAGFIHPVEVSAPSGVEFKVEQDTKLTITGPDKTRVGQIASNIRKIRPPEVYKGKGIRYLNEFIKLKAGKTAKAST